MSPPVRRPAVAAPFAAWLCLAAGSALSIGGCVGEANPGVDPPSDQLFFPAGLLLDPRRAPGEQARYLFASSGNNDLAFNAATITAIDIDAFFESWYDDEYGVFPYCEQARSDCEQVAMQAECDAAIGCGWDDADGTGCRSCGGLQTHTDCDDGAGCAWDSPEQTCVVRPRCVLDRGSETTDAFPCRRLALLPQVVECDEAPFVVDSVRVEDFVTVLDASVMEPHGVPRIWAPVRGGPSITYIDVATAPDGTPDLACGQRQRNGDHDDGARCADRFRLTSLRNDADLFPLDREPFNILIDEFVPQGETEPLYRYAYVAHSAGGALTLVDLDGLGGRQPGSTDATRPAIVDTAPVFIPIGFTASSPGGFGLARRPCSNEALSGANRPNSPSITLGCQRPLVYGSYRFQLNMTSFTVGGIDAPRLPPGLELDECVNGRDACPEGVSCLPGSTCVDQVCVPDTCVVDADCAPGSVCSESDNPDASTCSFVGPFCAGPEDLGSPCTIVCEPRVVSARPFLPGGVDPLSPTSAAALGDIAFADETGTKLYAVQTNPGALLQIDTSVDLDGETLDIPSGPPIELCNQPTRMKLFRAEGLAFVSCFRAALLYVVDLRARRVIEIIVTGTGPHDLTVDEVRRKLYVANSLESSISIIELDSTRTGYLREIARIGIQDPFSR